MKKKKMTLSLTKGFVFVECVKVIKENGNQLKNYQSMTRGRVFVIWGQVEFQWWK